jgi:hypothetical protein
MISQKTSISTLALIAVLATTAGIWSGDLHAQEQAQTQIYGSQLMTDAERSEYRSKMRTLKTDKERDSFRLDHHENMKVRAAEKGVTLPNTPQSAGSMNAPSGGGRGGR